MHAAASTNPRVPAARLAAACAMAVLAACGQKGALYLPEKTTTVIRPAAVTPPATAPAQEPPKAPVPQPEAKKTPPPE